MKHDNAARTLKHGLDRARDVGMLSINQKLVTFSAAADQPYGTKTAADSEAGRDTWMRRGHLISLTYCEAGASSSFSIGLDIR